MPARLKKNKGDVLPIPLVGLSTRVEPHVNAALEDYVWAFNRDNPGAGMSKSRLISSVIIRFLREAGAMDESSY
tara:strand:+ start:2732 stop:2953 length:222 start_codon:yes stop_codon:yes gene_type:complete